MTLNLQTPLYYVETQDFPAALIESDEYLLCYELDIAQSQSIEPNPEKFAGKLICTGKSDRKQQVIPSAKTVSLPAGSYLFTQHSNKTPLEKDAWLKIAVEQQKDGLWERHKLQPILYIRFLYEDGKYATQLFRPLL